jgi:triacylglycerol lipase
MSLARSIILALVSAMCMLFATTRAQPPSQLLPIAPGNTYPIILVHGFAGWGRDDLKYWGGNHGDWKEDMKKLGFDVRTVSTVSTMFPLHRLRETRQCKRSGNRQYLVFDIDIGE